MSRRLILAPLIAALLVADLWVVEGQLVKHVRKDGRAVKEEDALFEKVDFESKPEDRERFGGRLNGFEVPEFNQLQTSFSEILSRFFGDRDSVEEKSSGGGGSESSEGFDIESLFGGGSNSGEISTSNFGGLEGFFGRRQWWKGENVCKSEETTEEEIDDSDYRGHVFGSICQEVMDMYKCTIRLGQDGKVKVRKVMYQCCHGFTREQGKSGCSKTVDLKDLSEQLTDMNLTRFLEAVESTGLSDMLSGAADGNLTLFVPTNQAMDSLTSTEDIDFVLLDSKDKQKFTRDIVRGHMVDGWHPMQTWADEGRLQTANPEYKLRINRFAYPFPFWTANCARVLKVNQRSKTGFIHTVDRIIRPARQSLWEKIAQDPSFSVFASLIDEDLQKKLMDDKAYHTVFAFSDDTFNAAPAALQKRLKDATEKDGCATGYVKDLTLPLTLCSEAVFGQARVTSLGRHRLNLTRELNSDSAGGEEKSKFFVQGVEVESEDEIATNGILHVVDGIPLFDHMKDILEVAKTGGSKFVELAEKYKLPSTTLKDHRHTTLFVPVNSQLEDFKGEVNEELLKNHVADNLVEVTLKNRDTMIETAAGNVLTMRVKAPRNQNLFAALTGNQALDARIGCARIVRANVPACSGTVHFVDRVLTVPKKTVMRMLKDDQDKREFRVLVELSDLDKELDDPEFDGTVLAPSNEQVSDFLESIKDENILENPKLLKTFVKKHILKGRICCNSMNSRSNGLSFFTRATTHRDLNNDRVRSSTVGNSRYVNGVEIMECDGMATNGIVHSISEPFPHRRRSGSSRRRRVTLEDLFDQFGSNRRRQTSSSSSRRNRFDWPF